MLGSQALMWGPVVDDDARSCCVSEFVSEHLMLIQPV